MQLLAIIASSLVFVSAVPTYDYNTSPGQAEYLMLNRLLRNHVGNGRNVAEWLRMSFHDLANADGNGNGGPHGCIKDDPVRSFPENRQLDNAVQNLNLLVNSKLPNIKFPFGDVVSMAGKVAAERAYPCIRIKWRPGRGQCQAEQDLVPGPSIQTYAELQPILDRYKLSRKEFAILLAGAHGVAQAKFRILNGARPWTLQNSGFAFIRRTFELPWIPISGERVRTETPINHWFSAVAVIRLPVEMLFYPDVVKNNKILNPFVKGIKVEQDAYNEQGFLKNIKNEQQFNKMFADVMAKMLEIGLDPNSLGEWLDESPDSAEVNKWTCPSGLYFSKIADIQ